MSHTRALFNGQARPGQSHLARPPLSSQMASSFRVIGDIIKWRDDFDPRQMYSFFKAVTKDCELTDVRCVKVKSDEQAQEEEEEREDVLASYTVVVHSDESFEKFMDALDTRAKKHFYVSLRQS